MQQIARSMPTKSSHRWANKEMIYCADCRSSLDDRLRSLHEHLCSTPLVVIVGNPSPCLVNLLINWTDNLKWITFFWTRTLLSLVNSPDCQLLFDDWLTTLNHLSTAWTHRKGKNSSPLYIATDSAGLPVPSWHPVPYFFEPRGGQGAVCWAMATGCPSLQGQAVRKNSAPLLKPTRDSCADPRMASITCAKSWRTNAITTHEPMNPWTSRHKAWGATVNI